MHPQLLEQLSHLANMCNRSGIPRHSTPQVLDPTSLYCHEVKAWSIQDLQALSHSINARTPHGERVFTLDYAVFCVIGEYSVIGGLKAPEKLDFASLSNSRIAVHGFSRPPRLPQIDAPGSRVQTRLDKNLTCSLLITFITPGFTNSPDSLRLEYRFRRWSDLLSLFGTMLGIDMEPGQRSAFRRPENHIPSRIKGFILVHTVLKASRTCAAVFHFGPLALALDLMARGPPTSQAES
ncbi:hypothetical protein MBM_06975 [Drepanopeziza brunnea f. sp. 'multigermtubi' MB_m1]|uniref:Uncharacterized protein n=1 Tax=Marssonina brunnea f. sp. multigermtubi (strain MB_m1) TaxID=1072389 RepID=K1XQB5_MARBU|nr:uncharacterized protein MBM_06975 [Drepanopeziza brunnea f. sp. 'multigermtubi' MB_m1]EKD14764.1 hypothetical protein MBM_06975 [Drepanopeziza brunnea f. sp. 'multigermtubi' MB_m1]